jgi:hypothetical protein
MQSICLIERLGNGKRKYIEVIDTEKEFASGLRFGKRKAKAILANMEVIDKFVETNGKYPEQSIETYSEDLGCDIHCEKINEFIKYGRTIKKPYLKITFENTSKGFGLDKAETILKLKNEISEFAYSR